MINKRNQTKIKTLSIVAALAMAILAGPVQAGPLAGELGILTPETLAGNNPATGAPWAVGDQYRLAFHTSATTTATSADIATYNAWVQGLADASPLNIGANFGATWKVIGSTATVDARDNTSTNPNVDGSGHAIFLLDGSTVVANDYADFWDGAIQNIINITEQGTEWAYWPWSGTLPNGTAGTGGSSGNPLGSIGQVGQGNASVTTDWIWRVWTQDPPENLMPMYALSDPLVIILAGATNPSPANGATVPAGDVELSWTNLAPNVGSDVYVDVWFGTDPVTDFTKVVDAGVNTTSVTVNAPVADTYYWRVDSYIDGSPIGDPIEGNVWIFYVDDTDGDGLPDAYELLHTSPPSPTALNPGDDLDTDGLTNMEEYQIGTNPNDPDTDGDTLQDGDELAGAGLRPPTDPLDADTDDDTLDDGVETNTGIWVSASDTGTDPTDADHDNDGLKDGVETNTGTFVSDTDTGTNPTAADSDSDGAGDWYEVAASFTDPTNPGDNPGVPYPLPDPDSTPPDTTNPVKVYILSGQSNMVGIGYVNGTKPGSLQTITKTDGKFSHMLDASDNWTVRNDVWYEGVVTATAKKWLTVGCGAGADKIGPELQFGHLMGYYHDEPVIILKTSQGNRGIGWDFLPPGSEQFIYGDYTYAGYGDTPSRWLTGTTPEPIDWYAGKQYDDCVAAAHDVLDNFDTKFPQYAAQGYEIAGFVWWQGHKDQGEPYASRYELNMVNFINAFRAEFNAPNAPFVLATIGFGGWELAGAGLTVANGQLAVSGETGNYPEFESNVKTVESRDYWRSTDESPGTQGFHYNNNAETYMLVGDALGRGMINLISGDPSPPVWEELLLALVALKDHITGVAPLSAAEIAAHKATIDSKSQYMGDNATVIGAAFDLVETYDNTPGYGPLWINQGNFSRSSAPDDIHWTMYWVMQYIMDYTYTAANISSHEALLDGFKFECSSYFPGAAGPPVDPEVTYTATINGSYLDVWGHDVMHETRPSRKPTGTYLAPGTIATITVPSSIVGKGYEVRVGAHSWDNSNRPKCRRLDRSSVVYGIDSTQVKVASPLGGGIYIEVPEGQDAGIIDVQIKNAILSPFFSAKSFHSTTLSEWQNVERHHPGPWADFQSEKFMMQVPTSWIYNFDDPVTLMQDWDKAMDAINDLMGYPSRSRETMYPQVDLQFRASVYAPGYPSVNVKYDPTRDYGGNYGHHLLLGPQYAPDYLFHEEGHGYLFVKFPGEMESTVNLLHVPVWHRKFGYDLDYAFAASRGYHGNPHRTLDNTAVTWMTVFNFSPREVPMAAGEKAYQLKGHAKFVEIARLFGWEALGNFWYSINVDYENGIYWSRHGSNIDDLILRWCESVGVDLRPLFHFWGTHPVDPVALKAAIAAEGLPQSLEIYNTLIKYKSLVPADNAAFQAFALAWWGHQPSINGYWTEREHTRQWDSTSYWQDNGWDYCGTDPDQADGEIYTEATCARIKAVIDELIDLYFPYGPPDTGDAEAPTPNPMTFEIAPHATGENSIAMTATEAADISWVEYYFTCTAGGGHDSGWQVSRTYEDTGLTPDTLYTYTVTARDKSAAQNATDASQPASARTNVVDVFDPTPDPMTWHTAPNATSSSTILMRATTASDTSGVEYYFTCTSGGGSDSGWQDDTYYTDAGLTAGTEYTYTVTARDKSPQQNTTDASIAGSATTLPATTDPYIVLSKPVYAPYEDIVVHFANAEGNWGDWVAIFHPTTPSTNYDEIQWMYTDGTHSGTAGIYNGTLIFDGLSADSYQARIHFNDGYTIEDSVDFTIKEVAPPPIEAEIKLMPNTLNLRSKGRWVMCLIRLGEDYDVGDIDPDSVLLEEEIVADRVVLEAGVAMVKFSRSALQELLGDLDTPVEAELLVTGQLNDGTLFEGTDVIRVIDKRSKNSLARGSMVRKIRTTNLQPKGQIARKTTKTANP